VSDEPNLVAVFTDVFFLLPFLPVAIFSAAVFTVAFFYHCRFYHLPENAQILI